jgi:hypothetical protein
VLGQHRSTQRTDPRGKHDKERLTADLVALARQYARYGYRTMAELLRSNYLFGRPVSSSATCMRATSHRISSRITLWVDLGEFFRGGNWGSQPPIGCIETLGWSGQEG